jgi:hypothetical protein
MDTVGVAFVDLYPLSWDYLVIAELLGGGRLPCAVGNELIVLIVYSKLQIVTARVSLELLLVARLQRQA